MVTGEKGKGSGRLAPPNLKPNFTHGHPHTPVQGSYVRDYPGEPVPKR